MAARTSKQVRMAAYTPRSHGTLSRVNKVSAVTLYFGSDRAQPEFLVSGPPSHTPVSRPLSSP
eukprot:3246015-Prymnesium_polylepis.1